MKSFMVVPVVGQGTLVWQDCLSRRSLRFIIFIIFVTIIIIAVFIY